MIALLLQLATATPTTPAMTPTPVAVRQGQTRTLADVARERKGKPKPSGAFSAAAGPPGVRPTYSAEQLAACRGARVVGVLDDAETKFAAELATARVTPRVSLAAQISRLRDIQTVLESDQTDVPQCARLAKGDLKTWMRLCIDNLNFFLSNAYKPTVGEAWDELISNKPIGVGYDRQAAEDEAHETYKRERARLS